MTDNNPNTPTMADVPSGWTPDRDLFILSPRDISHRLCDAFVDLRALMDDTEAGLIIDAVYDELAGGGDGHADDPDRGESDEVLTLRRDDITAAIASTYSVIRGVAPDASGIVVDILNDHLTGDGFQA